MDRRRFLARVVQAFSALIAGLLALPLVRFLSASAGEEASEWYPIADISSLTEEISQVSFTRNVQDGWLSRAVEEYVWVRKERDGSFVVYEPHCTHLGCAYAWNPAKHEFDCPCHGGKFNADGRKIAGPPPRPLDRYATKIEGGVLKIGKIVRA